MLRFLLAFMVLTTLASLLTLWYVVHAKQKRDEYGGTDDPLSFRLILLTICLAIVGVSLSIWILASL